MSKIKLGDSIEEILKKVSEGNPGALRVCVDMIKNAKKTDPDNLLDAFWPLAYLDSFEIYGPDVWVLFEYVCKEDLVKTLAIIRAIQTNIISLKKVKKFIEDKNKDIYIPCEGLDFDNILSELKNKIPNFGKDVK